MAFEDILTAITQETDRRIVDAEDAHKRRLAELREQNDRRLQERKRQLEDEFLGKKQALRTKADNDSSQSRRNAILRKKQELLERFYGEIRESLVKQKPTELEKFFKRCLDDIGSKGTILPAKAHAEMLKKVAGNDFTIGAPIDVDGGFVLLSNDKEFDFTFESLVNGGMRPRTEVEVSRALFE